MRLATLGALAAALLALPAAAARIDVPGTAVSLEPPPGFVLAERFPGFGNEQNGASILVTEIPGPFSAVIAGMTPEGLASRGMTMESTERLPAAGGGETLLVGATQRAGETMIRKWLAISGDETASRIVMASFPAEAAELAAPLRAAVLSAGPAAAPPDRLAGLPFTVVERAPLAIAHRVANGLLLTESGVLRTLAPGEPRMVVGASLSGVDLADLAAFATARLAKSDQFTAGQTLRSAAVDVGGLSGWEIEAEGADQPSGETVRIYQLIVRDGPTSYLIAQAMVAPARWAELLPAFHAVGRSMRPRSR
jgi:hypothetical protein